MAVAMLNSVHTAPVRALATGQRTRAMRASVLPCRRPVAVRASTEDEVWL